jgi:hypothetical protein
MHTQPGHSAIIDGRWPGTDPARFDTIQQTQPTATKQKSPWLCTVSPHCRGVVLSKTLQSLQRRTTAIICGMIMLKVSNRAHLHQIMPSQLTHQGPKDCKTPKTLQPQAHRAGHYPHTPLTRKDNPSPLQKRHASTINLPILGAKCVGTTVHDKPTQQLCW